jgi:hypothetical protein
VTEPDHGEVADGIERQLGIERGRGRLADMHQQDRVAVGCSLGDAVGAEGAAGADDVFDDDRLLQRRSHRRPEQPSDHIARPPGRERNDHRDRPAREFLAECRRYRRQQQHQQNAFYKLHGNFLSAPRRCETIRLEQISVIHPRSPFRSMRMSVRSC